MKNILNIICILLSLTMTASASEASVPSINTSFSTEPVSSVMSATEEKVRAAAVRVVATRGGHGSGSLVKYKGLTLVITAKHVANGSLGTIYYIMTNNETKAAILVYLDPNHDMSLLYLPEDFVTAEPLKFSTKNEIASVGEEITYSGFPSSHQLMTFRGRVAGYETLEGPGLQILLHTHGWFGCSGSLVYDNDGDIVGILWGIDTAKTGYGPQIIENMVWVQPIQALDLDRSLASLCASLQTKVRACR